MFNNNLKITIIGSGTCVPSLKRNPSSILVETENEKLLFDTGSGTMKQLLRVGVKISEITHIFYTHFHPDHTGELVSFLFSSKYAGLSRTIPLILTGGSGFINFYEKLIDVYGSWIEFSSNMLEIREMNNKSTDCYTYDSFQILSTPVAHNTESIAYKIKFFNGKSLVYSGDTDYSDNLISLAKDCDLLICESAFPDDKKVNGHLTPILAGEIAEKSRSKKLVLTHLYPECERIDIRAQCSKAFTGPIIIAEDLMSFSL